MYVILPFDIWSWPGGSCPLLRSWSTEGGEMMIGVVASSVKFPSRRAIIVAERLASYNSIVLPDSSERRSVLICLMTSSRFISLNSFKLKLISLELESSLTKMGPFAVRLELFSNIGPPTLFGCLALALLKRIVALYCSFIYSGIIFL